LKVEICHGAIKFTAKLGEMVIKYEVRVNSNAREFDIINSCIFDWRALVGSDREKICLNLLPTGWLESLWCAGMRVYLVMSPLSVNELPRRDGLHS